MASFYKSLLIFYLISFLNAIADRHLEGIIQLDGIISRTSFYIACWKRNNVQNIIELAQPSAGFRVTRKLKWKFGTTMNRLNIYYFKTSR